MKNLTRIALALALIAVVPAAAGAAKARTESGEYNTFTIDTDALPNASGRISNAVTFEVRSTERYVSVIIEDSYVEKVSAVVYQDANQDGTPESETWICTASTAPIKVKPGVPVTVSTQEGLCEDDSPSTPTVGKITATFTR